MTSFAVPEEGLTANDKRVAARLGKLERALGGGDVEAAVVADKVGKCWTLGSGMRKDPGPWEGELRNMWKPTHQEALWLHGGNLHQSRHYSLYLALQIKAREVGIATPVYGVPEVHHRS